MTTQQFISNTYGTTREDNRGSRHCSSVFTTYDGTVYSYGLHYPLAFKLNGLDVINVAGYSNTTAKHINWAVNAIGHHAIQVKLSREDSTVIASDVSEDAKLKTVLDALAREATQLKAELDAKKRKDTKVYASIRSNYQRVIQDWATVLEATR